MNWYSMRTEDDTAYVSLWSDIGCYGKKSSDFAAELGKPRKVELFISSSGGSSVCGLNLFHILKDFDVDVLISGQCCSAAVVVAMAGRVIKIRRDAKILIHPPVVHSIGTPAQLRADAKRLANRMKAIVTIIMRRSCQPEPVVREWLSKDTWLNADEALVAGLVDEIVEPPRLMRSPSEVPLSAVCNGATEDERLIQAMLTGLGPVQVPDKAAFGRELAAWFSRNVKEV
jgi:ATP-dependent Clp protease protease subunit